MSVAFYSVAEPVLQGGVLRPESARKVGEGGPTARFSLRKKRGHYPRVSRRPRKAHPGERASIGKGWQVAASPPNSDMFAGTSHIFLHTCVLLFAHRTLYTEICDETLFRVGCRQRPGEPSEARRRVQDSAACLPRSSSCDRRRCVSQRFGATLLLHWARWRRYHHRPLHLAEHRYPHLRRWLLEKGKTPL